MKMNPYNMPQIIKETSDGYFHLSVLDDLLSQREIYCLGEIDADSAGSLILQLQYLAVQDPEAEITLYINSPGGSVADGLALYDIMQTIPCPIRTVCMGTAASFGALLFTAGDTREIFPHSKIMIHDPLIAGQGLTGSATLLHTKIDSLMETRQILGELLARHTGKTLEEIYEKTAQDTWFTASEAVDYGLADTIIQTAETKSTTKSSEEKGDQNND